MKIHNKQFLDPDRRFCDFDTAGFCILPFAYEGGVSYGRGTALAPEAILDASGYLEQYDETMDAEPFRAGIATMAPPEVPFDAQEAIDTVYRESLALMEKEKFTIVLGGDHSISSGYYRALKKKYGEISVVQLDAHADLRDAYEGSLLSHACVMRRIREHTVHTLQIGIRSISAEEARYAEESKCALIYMHRLRETAFDLGTAFDLLPDPVFLTLDVDVMDWSVIASTGTPEPGGLLWDEALKILKQLFLRKRVVGFDVVELCSRPEDRNSPFAAAKLVYKMIGFAQLSAMKKGIIPSWPEYPGSRMV